MVCFIPSTAPSFLLFAAGRSPATSRAPTFRTRTSRGVVRRVWNPIACSNIGSNTSTNNANADADSDSDSDSNILSSSATSIPPKSKITESDRRQVDAIAAAGERQLDAVAEEVRSEAAGVAASTEELADKLISEETQSLLKRSLDKQTGLLDAVRAERDNIQREMDALQNIAVKGNSSNKSTDNDDDDDDDNKKMQRKTSVLQTVTALFAFTAVYYVFNALAFSDAAAMRSAVVDGAVAVLAAFFLTKSKNKHNSN